MAASGEKPYKVYRGGRASGDVPLSRKERRASREPDGGGRTPHRGRGGWSWKRWTLVVVLALIAFLVAWSAIGYVSVSKGVSDANKRLPAGTTAVLAKQSGLMLSSPSNILLLGTDHASNGQAGRSTDQHSDSLMLLRTDPGKHRLTFLSIPRDFKASIPGYGDSKINAAMQIGGPKLAIRTVDALFGPQLQINHVVVVDFGSFVKLIDAIGGIDVNVPENILSDKFDCPYAAQRCVSWKGWRFHKGVQHLSGHEALIFSRIRVNQLDPSWTDIKRAENQQQVMQATMRKLASVGTFFSLPFDGSTLLAPLATDLSTWDFAQLAWVKFRAGATVHCRLGGSPVGGYIEGDQHDIAVIQMVLGNSAPQPPAPDQRTFGAGCVTGNQSFK